MKKHILLIFLLLNFTTFASDWKLVKALTDGGIYDMICYDSLNCYALYKKPLGPEIYKTTDAGKNWNMIYTSNFIEEGPPYLINAHRLYIADSNNLYITFSENLAIFKQSTDGGKTFKKTKISDTTFVSWLTHFIMLNKDVGIAINDTNAYITYDNWKTVKYKNDSIFRVLYPKIQKYDDNNIIFITDRYSGVEIIKYNLTTFDKETIVKFEPKNIDKTLKLGFKFLSDTLSYIVGEESNGVGQQSKDIIFKTNGSLKNWIKVIDKEVEPIFGLQEVGFYDTKNGFATGQSGKILTTKDGGNTWLYEVPKDIYVGDDKVYGPSTMRVAWAGKTPLFGTFGGNIYRYEGNFFDFTEPKLVLENPKIETLNCNKIVNREFQLQSWNIELNWNKVNNAKKYEVEISEFEDFKTNYFRLDGISSNVLIVPNLIDFEQDKLYYWRVRAYSDTVYSEWSNNCQFITKIDNATNIAPTCGETIFIGDVTLLWSENPNASKYLIEISHNEDFSALIKQDSAQISEYKFKTPVDSIYYWRIKTIGSNSDSDWSNKNENCNFIKKTGNSIESNISNEENFIFPNPVKDILTLDMKNEDITNFQFEILDIAGSRVLEGTLVNSLNINVSNLLKGTYILKFNSKSQKFIKE
jgi:photosystem II stability/assembly factor-like uncharacterized protein